MYEVTFLGPISFTSTLLGPCNNLPRNYCVIKLYAYEKENNSNKVINNKIILDCEKLFRSGNCDLQVPETSFKFHMKQKQKQTNK